MSNYVRIKNSKNLRFKLISLLYLLFISLSIIQIPIEWLRINGPITSYFLKPQVENIKKEELKNVYEIVLKLDKEFTKTIVDSETGKLNEPNEYASTDVFFIKQNNAIKLHQELHSLSTYFSKLPANNIKKITFDKLFIEDLDNGLNNKDGTKWAEWKFKHTPASVAISLLAELQLRLNLLNGDIEVKDDEKENEPLLNMAFNVENLRVGDSLKLVFKDKRLLKATVTEGGKTLSLNNWNGDTLLFIPTHVGEYDLDFDRAGKKEKFHLSSGTKGFSVTNENKFQTFYEGKKSKLNFLNLPDVQSVTCDCDHNPILSKTVNCVEFIPYKNGWCKFIMISNGNRLLLSDSVYVQSVPVPFIFVDGSSENNLSYSRLMQTKTISFDAKHPEMPGFEYKIESVKLRLVGIDNNVKTIIGCKMQCTDEEIRKLKFLIVEAVNIKSTNKKFDVLKQFVIQINK
ncbi:MAG: hypothetical protein H7296_11535 [Bacteroidia bacterium]|nr:hypothetical protein [Bacteroidia bacterium]